MYSVVTNIDELKHQVNDVLAHGISKAEIARRATPLQRKGS